MDPSAKTSILMHIRLESCLTNPYKYMLAENCLKSEICIHAVWWYTYILCGMCLHAVEQCMCLSMLKYLYVSVRKCAELCFKRKHQVGITGSVPYRGPEKGTQAVKKTKLIFVNHDLIRKGPSLKRGSQGDKRGAQCVSQSVLLWCLEKSYVVCIFACIFLTSLT